MKKRLAMLFALCLMTGVLSSCGKDTSSTETTKKDDNTLVILNYGKYIDESVLDQFEKETGIKVKFLRKCIPSFLQAPSIMISSVPQITWWSV